MKKCKNEVIGSSYIPLDNTITLIEHYQFKREWDRFPFLTLYFQNFTPTSHVSAVMTGVPESVFRISEALKQNGLEKICFDDSPAHSEFIALRNALDARKPINLCSFFIMIFLLIYITLPLFFHEVIFRLLDLFF